MKKSIEKFQAEAVERAKERLIQQAREVNGVKVITTVLPMTPEAAKDLAFKLRAAQPENMLCVIGSKHDNKPLLTVMATDDLVSDRGFNAGKVIREAAKLIQGGGGGQPHFATAGGKNVDGLSAGHHIEVVNRSLFHRLPAGQKRRHIGSHRPKKPSASAVPHTVGTCPRRAFPHTRDK